MKKAYFAAVGILLCAVAGGIYGQARAQGEADDFFDTSWPAVSQPHTQITLSSKLRERIARIAVEEGDAIKKEDVLIEFDARLINARIALAEVAADFAARLESSRTRYDYLKGEHDRSVTLDFAESRADLDRAKFEMEMARLDLAELDRSKREADQQLAAYKYQAEDYTILSPIDGVVSRLWIEEAEMASEGLPLVKVIDPGVVEVRLHPSERFVKLVARGQKVVVKFPAADDQEFTGSVYVVSPDVDSSSHTFLVRILVEPGRDDVRPGMGCEVRFLPR